ncbi:MAG: nucleotide exchange factor GrpE [Coprothermobacter sp.]|jgi:molecular chaperone GrpE|nr:nucleotide exchange factor GrpE [Coprothermobacter sp.]
MMNRSRWYVAGEERGTGKDDSERVPSVLEVPLDSAPDHEDGDGGEALRTLGSRIRELQHEVERLNSAVHEEQMLRIREQATLQRDKSSFEARTKLGLFLDLLAVVDSFDQLVKHGEGTQDDSSLLVGSQAVLGQLNQFLARNGVHRLEGLEGNPYDSATSEIAHVVADPDAPVNTVVRVLRDGYKLGEMLLRPAMVDVASAPQASVESDDTGED